MPLHTKPTSQARPRNTPPDALFAQESFRTPRNDGSDRRAVGKRTLRVHSGKISIARASCFARGAVGTGNHSIFSSTGGGKFQGLYFVSWRGRLFARAVGSH